jgi:hypothetical protein
MRADDGGVDHLHRVWRRSAIGDGFEKHVPHARNRPPEKLAIDRAPFAKLLWQIAPRRPGPGDPENPVEDIPVVLGRSSPLTSRDQHLFEKGPFLIVQPPSNQFRLLPRGSLESKRDSTVNHFVNNT